MQRLTTIRSLKAFELSEFADDWRDLMRLYMERYEAVREGFVGGHRLSVYWGYFRNSEQQLKEVWKILRTVGNPDNLNFVRSELIEN